MVGMEAIILLPLYCPDPSQSLGSIRSSPLRVPRNYPLLVVPYWGLYFLDSPTGLGVDYYLRCKVHKEEDLWAPTRPAILCFFLGYLNEHLEDRSRKVSYPVS